MSFFSGSTRGKARSRAYQLTNVCCLCHRREKGKKGKGNKEITHLKWLDSKNLPLPSGFSGLRSPCFLKSDSFSPLSYLRPQAVSPLFSWGGGKEGGNVLFQRKGVPRKKEKKKKLLFSSLMHNPRCPIVSFFLTQIFGLLIIKVTGRSSNRRPMFMHSN